MREPVFLSLKGHQGEYSLGQAFLAEALTRVEEASLAGDLPDCPLALIIEGGHDGEPFCEGLDLSVAGEQVDFNSGIRCFARLLETIEEFPAPVVAVVDGPARGGGVGLAAVADLVIAGKPARFALPETLFGLVPAVVFPWIARRIGVARTRAMALGLLNLDVVAAHQVGLVDVITDQPWAEVKRRLRSLRATEPSAVTAVRAMTAGLDAPDASSGNLACERFTALSRRDVVSRRIRSFLDGDVPW